MIGAKIRYSSSPSQGVNDRSHYGLYIGNTPQMTGQLVYVAADATRFGWGTGNDSLINNLPDKSYSRNHNFRRRFTPIF